MREITRSRRCRVSYLNAAVNVEHVGKLIAHLCATQSYWFGLDMYAYKVLAEELTIGLVWTHTHMKCWQKS